MFSATVISGASDSSWWISTMPRCFASCGPDTRIGSPSEVDLAAIGLVVAGEHLHQGRLAGAVLAEQRVDLAGAHLERDVVERLHPGERLGDAVDVEERSAGAELVELGLRVVRERSHSFTSPATRRLMRASTSRTAIRIAPITTRT